MGPIERFRERLLSKGVGTTWTIRGCLELEIRFTEWKLGLRFPGVYRQFLSEMGRSAGRLFVGIDIYFPTVLGLRAAAEALLAENASAFKLSPTHHVFLLHQGYTFSYFDTASGVEDPPVWTYLEGDGNPTQSDPSFSSFLERHLDAAR